MSLVEAPVQPEPAASEPVAADTRTRQLVTIDGNEAAAYVAHRTNEVVAIYPITPASPMGEWADQWTADGRPNLWGTVPEVIEMQSEGGAAGVVHGALQTGALTTTFTASQGLLLMIPNMYKIAGELTPTVFHIAARSLAAQALSIFGDHSDVMAARATGWGMLFANNVQEVMDFALVSQAVTLRARLPFLHVFDGFRTSHEIQKIEQLADDDLRALLPDELIRAHRERALTPERPVIRGTAQNPDVYFQARETVNPYYLAAPGIVQEAMDALAARTGRAYRLFDYVGAPDAERVVVLMGSGCEAAEEAVEHLAARGERVGLVKVRLFRPFSAEHLLQALPPTVRAVAVLDRTKEPGSAGEPLYQDVITALAEGAASGAVAAMPRVIGGRYGLSSKEFTPAMVRTVLDELSKDAPKNHFTIGITDDVTHTSLPVDPDFDVEPGDVTRAVFWGLGSDGTVGANKNSITIIGEETNLHAQGYFVYDSRKAGARTISHLRFGPRPIRSTYLIRRAGFVAVHQFGFLTDYDTLALVDEGATFLLNSPYGPDEVWDRLPRRVQKQIIDKGLRFFVIDAHGVAGDLGLGGRINTVMQPCFFALSGVLPREEAIDAIKASIRKTYGKRGEAVVRMNFAAVDAALARLHEVAVPEIATSEREVVATSLSDAPAFVQSVTARMLAGEGDLLPVSALPVDGTYPVATTRYEKRNLALEVPVWEADLCIQCGKCVMVCPHAVIRAKVVDEADLARAPEGFESLPAAWRELEGMRYTLQVAVEDCTGCELCVEICPARDKSEVRRKALNMAPQLEHRAQGIAHWDFFRSLPENTPVVATTEGDGAPPDGYVPLPVLKFGKSKDVQLLEPLFEFSSACAGCGETPYLSLLTRLFGDRTLVANATGCSSIYGGNLPTTPWAANRAGRGPAWSNSLFEDNAEFGLGMRLSLDKQAAYARELVERLGPLLGDALADGLIAPGDTTPGAVEAQRQRVAALRVHLEGAEDPAARDLLALADALVPKSVWIVGGDGWAYDIGYGGLDHVMASGRNVNLLVLDTEVYSNTGGQASKSTGLGAVAKFASGGKKTPKKDLGLLATSYGYVYVAQVAMGADDNHVVKTFLEAEAYDGPSIIIAYSQCIAHGIDMAKGMEQADMAVACGHWPLYRFDPRRTEAGLNPFQLDSKPPRLAFRDYAYRENRYRMLQQVAPDEAAVFMKQAQEDIERRWRRLEQLARGAGGDGEAGAAPPTPGAEPPGARPAGPPSGVKPAGPPPAGVKPAGPPPKRPS
jgi:pyruvate-ferredoxin/flavodoxin oxidoreductase